NINVLEVQIRECFGRVVYSHKTQEKCADIIQRRHKHLKIIQIIISALITTGLVIKLLGDNQIALYISVILSTILLALNSYTKDYDLGEIMQKHANAANELWNVRESYLSLLVDMKSGIVSIDQIIEKRNELQNKLANIYSGSPRTNSKAYKEASNALKLTEEMTFSDKEIDAFLPLELRKTK
ncbi:MAG: SLATT domain-containing protein, partial [Dysgonamonadaceae bacterium]|nr:SLATT domain-containing protein [Dysgonamonadaceae bacterium]